MAKKKVNYDRSNELYALTKAREARKKKNLTASHAAQKVLDRQQRTYTKMALSLRAKQDRKKK